MTDPPSCDESVQVTIRRLNDSGVRLLAGGHPDQASADLTTGLALVTSAEASSPDAQDPSLLELRARLLVNLSSASQETGALSTARDHLDEAVLLTDRLLASPGPASHDAPLTDLVRSTAEVATTAHLSRALLRCALGQVDDALTDLDRASRLLPKVTDDGTFTVALHNARCEVLLSAGRLQDAGAAARLALTSALENRPDLAGHPYTNLAVVADRSGDDMSARAYLSLAHEVQHLVGDAAARQLAEENLARAALADGDLETARDGFVRAARSAAEAGLRLRAAACHSGLAAVHRLSGDSVQAAQVLDDLLAGLAGTRSAAALYEAFALRADVAVDLGDPAEAEQLLLAARQHATSAHDRCRVDLRRVEVLVDQAAATPSPEVRAALLRTAVDLVLPATLATDALRHGLDPGPLRELWVTQIASSAVALAFTVVAATADTRLMLELMEHMTATSFSLSAAVRDLPGHRSAVLAALPPRVVMVPGQPAALDEWILRAEALYGVAVRSSGSVVAW